MSGWHSFAISMFLLVPRSISEFKSCPREQYLLLSLSSHMIMVTPSLSNWGRPARPAICIISRSEYSWEMPPRNALTSFITTMWDGRFTPTARAEVATTTRKIPFIYNSSTARLSK
ncbi:hypothetical protein BJV77DRAFT_1022415 [Russula vinacea]|nr:hypothetical protein BJV77DRAFT_1022415 [Russula vinacea]